MVHERWQTWDLKSELMEGNWWRQSLGIQDGVLHTPSIKTAR